MAHTPDNADFRRRVQRIETLIREIDRLADPDARVRTRELVQAVLDLHGTGLERLLDRVAEAAGPAVIEAAARDDLVGSLLLLHGLHPLDLETRVRQALEAVKPTLRSHGGTVELLGIADGVVRLRARGSWHSSSASVTTLKLAVEEAVYAKVPDVTAVEVEGLTQTWDGVNGHARFALPVLQH
jgi:Fe-S cluster biogenesis protein NfuA